MYHEMVQYLFSSFGDPSPVLLNYWSHVYAVLNPRFLYEGHENSVINFRQGRAFKDSARDI